MKEWAGVGTAIADVIFTNQEWLKRGSLSNPGSMRHEKLRHCIMSIKLNFCRGKMRNADRAAANFSLLPGKLPAYYR